MELFSFSYIYTNNVPKIIMFIIQVDYQHIKRFSRILIKNSQKGKFEKNMTYRVNLKLWVLTKIIA